MYLTWLIISIATLVLGFTLTYTFYKKSIRNDKPMQLVPGFVITTFLSATFMYIPFHYVEYANKSVSLSSSILVGIRTFFVSAIYTIRMFIVENDIKFITAGIKRMPQELQLMYAALAAVLAVIAPILTFSVVVAFIRNATASLSFVKTYKKDYYVFSELSDKSIALAESIKINKPKCKILFTDVFESDTEESYSLMQQAKTLDATCFKKDIRYIRYNAHSKKKSITFFVIGEDEAENVRQAVDLIEEYKNRENTEMYIFSSKCEGDMILSSIDKGNIKVRRVYDYNAMINKYLFDRGIDLFEEAYDSGVEGENKKINAIILGVGSYGFEMTKALAWYCQMDGYDITIDAFDKNENTEDKFLVNCPELIDEKHNGLTNINEARYTINIYSGVDVDSSRFIKELEKIDCPTFIFVSLGNDSENIRIASYIRMLYERKHMHPHIVSVVYDGNLSEKLKGANNFKGQKYDIEYIGALREVYSEETIMNSELEEKGLLVHTKDYQSDASEFWKYEYNYNSSLAAAIHKRVKKHFDIIENEDDNVEELKKTNEELARIEHARWNAYTRSIGYIYSGSQDKETRCDLAKMHNLLVGYDELNEFEKDKDRRVATLDREKNE